MARSRTVQRAWAWHRQWFSTLYDNIDCIGAAFFVCVANRTTTLSTSLYTCVSLVGDSRLLMSTDQLSLDDENDIHSCLFYISIGMTWNNTLLLNKRDTRKEWVERGLLVVTLPVIRGCISTKMVAAVITQKHLPRKMTMKHHIDIQIDDRMDSSAKRLLISSKTWTCAFCRAKSRDS